MKRLLMNYGFWCWLCLQVPAGLLFGYGLEALTDFEGPETIAPARLNFEETVVRMLSDCSINMSQTVCEQFKTNITKILILFSHITPT